MDKNDSTTNIFDGRVEQLLYEVECLGGDIRDSSEDYQEQESLTLWDISQLEEKAQMILTDLKNIRKEVREKHEPKN